MRSKEALLEAIKVEREYAYRIGIPRYTYNNMADVWLLQPDFECLTLTKVKHLINSSRFRQAWHLFSARCEINQVEPSISKWWDTYVDANDKTQKELLNKLMR